MNGLAKEQFEKLKEKHQKEFNIWWWLFRLAIMSVTFALLVMYLRDHNKQMNSEQTEQGEMAAKKSDSNGRPEIKIPVFRAKGE